MKTPITLIAAAMLLCGLLPAPASATVLIFLKIDGPLVQGNSTVLGHEHEIEIVTFKSSITQPRANLAAGGTASPAASVLKPIIVYKFLDNATIPLMVGCALGGHYNTALITVGNTSGGQLDDVFKIRLTEVFIGSTDLENSGSGAADNMFLLEAVALSYGKIEWVYYPRTGLNTPVTGGFDVKANKALRPPPF